MDNTLEIWDFFYALSVEDKEHMYNIASSWYHEHCSEDIKRWVVEEGFTLSPLEKELASANNIVGAVRMLRNRTKWNLKFCKEQIDKYMKESTDGTR